MSTGRRTLRYGRETLLALLVLALCFLNYGHVGLTSAGELTVTPDSWCGDPLLPGQLDHPPCHACRIGGGADLPPPPLAATPVVFAVEPVAYAVPAFAGQLPVQVRPAQPRGPPALV